MSSQFVKHTNIHHQQSEEQQSEKGARPLKD